MKVLLFGLLALFGGCSDLISETTLKSNESIITNEMNNENSTVFDINISQKLPDTPINFAETKESCEERSGTFVSLAVVGDKKRKLCLSADSLKSSASFLRYGADFLSIAWAGFVGDDGAKKFSAIVEMGSYCSQSAVGACIDVYLGEGSYDKAKMELALSSRPRILEDGTVELLVREYLDNPMIEKIIKDNVNGVRLTDSFKNVIAGMAVNIISMNIPNKFSIKVGDFKNLGNDLYSVKSDIFLPEEWLANNKGDLKIPIAAQIVKLLPSAAGLAPLAKKVSLMVNHDCNAMLLSANGDQNICLPVDKSSVEFIIESPAITNIIAGEKLASSFEKADHSYRSLQVKLTGLGLGLAKTESSSCSYKDPENYACDVKYSLEALKYDAFNESMIISLSNGLKTVSGHAEAGQCLARYALRPSFKKLVSEKIPYSQLYPFKGSARSDKGFSDKLFYEISCYAEVKGSCECSANGKPWICEGESCR